MLDFHLISYFRNFIVQNVNKAFVYIITLQYMTHRHLLGIFRKTEDWKFGTKEFLNCKGHVTHILKTPLKDLKHSKKY